MINTGRRPPRGTVRASKAGMASQPPASSSASPRPPGFQDGCLRVWNGSWVHVSSTPPPYRRQVALATRNNPQSQHILDSPMCRRSRSWKWQWVSRDARCSVPPASRESVCSRLAGKRILLYGDSLTQQFFVSIASLAGEDATSEASRPDGCERLRHLECLRVCGGLVCQRTHFGLALDAVPVGVPHNCSSSIRPSVVAPIEERYPASCLGAFDLVVINQAAHWVGNDGALGLQQCLVERGSMGQFDAASFAIDWITRLYTQQMQRDASHLQSITQARGSSGSPRIFYRTSAPASPTQDILPPDTPNGEPPIYTRPSRSDAWLQHLGEHGSPTRFNHHLLPKYNAIARSTFLAAGHGIMDVELPMSFRVDGHLDALHYCLPGPVDFYSSLLPLLLA